MHETLVDVLVLLGAALALGALAERFRQSAVLGYLVAGTLVGPNGLAWVGGGDVHGLADLGAAVLLFSIGTEFSLDHLKRLGSRAFGAGVLQVAFTTVAGFAVARLAGLPASTSFAVGAIVSLSSTAVIARLLAERQALDRAHGRLSMGVLLTQDLAVVPLVLAVSIAAGDLGLAAATTAAGKTALYGGGLAFAFLLLVRFVVPRFFRQPGVSRNRELVAVFAATCALGSALAAEAVGLPAALGAFLAGALLGGSPFATVVRSEVAPLRTLLLTVFFAAIGLSGDPAWVAANLGPSIGITALVVLGKAAIVFGIARILGFAPGVAIAAGLCLAQVGEFSFVLAQSARAAGSLDPQVFSLIVTATIVSLALAPPAVALAGRLATGGSKAPAASPVADRSPQVLVIGFGPAGQVAVERLPPDLLARTLVIDANPSLVSLARSRGFAAELGDATRADVLEHAGLRGARALAITVSDHEVTRQVAELSRLAAPDLAILARARYHLAAAAIAQAGADPVIDEEQLVGERIAAGIVRVAGTAPAA